LRKLSAAAHWFDVLDALDEIESEYAVQIGEGEFAELKQRMAELLDQIDPGGRLG
jgi:hypothetical protein